MENRIANTLRAIDSFEITGSSFQALEFDNDDFEAVIDNDDFENSDAFTTGKVQIDFVDMDLISWKRDLETDHTLILLLREEMNKITPKDDFKLQHLKTYIANKIANPINPGNKKILIFTAFADTANYLYEHITEDLLKKNTHSAKVTGSDTAKTTLGKGFDYQKILTFFSPASKEKNLIFPDETGEIDLLSV